MQSGNNWHREAETTLYNVLTESVACRIFPTADTGVSHLLAQSAAQVKLRVYFHTWDSDRPFSTSWKAPRDVGPLETVTGCAYWSVSLPLQRIFSSKTESTHVKVSIQKFVIIYILCQCCRVEPQVVTVRSVQRQRNVTDGLEYPRFSGRTGRALESRCVLTRRVVASRFPATLFTYVHQRDLSIAAIA